MIHIVGKLAKHCKTLKSPMSKQMYIFHSTVYQTTMARSLCLFMQSVNDKKVNMRRYSDSTPHVCLGFVEKRLSEALQLRGVDEQSFPFFYGNTTSLHLLQKKLLKRKFIKG